MSGWRDNEGKSDSLNRNDNVSIFPEASMSSLEKVVPFRITGETSNSAPWLPTVERHMRRRIRRRSDGLLKRLCWLCDSHPAYSFERMEMGRGLMLTTRQRARRLDLCSELFDFIKVVEAKQGERAILRRFLKWHEGFERGSVEAQLQECWPHLSDLLVEWRGQSRDTNLTLVRSIDDSFDSRYVEV